MRRFPVSEAKERALQKRMEELGLFESEIEESFVRSGGAGGQNVNKVATCVVLKHPPSGLEVKCQRARTQGMNRYHARALLAEKMDTLINQKKSKEQQRIEKIRRQKRKRSKRAKEKMLENKKKQSVKKDMRKPVSEDED
ncbi:MAG: peptide chain release factor-like protein [Thermodesulfovibrionales bacterium]|nr:peptide chain release factor-like protein [Thermodesulfovibrionales bacterium]